MLQHTLISIPFFIKIYLKNSFCSWRYHKILTGNASQRKSNLSSAGGLNFKKCKCGRHACHRSATVLSYCKSHHGAFHIWNRKTCYVCKTRGSFTSHISMLRRMNAQLQRPTLSDLCSKVKGPRQSSQEYRKQPNFQDLKKYKHQVICYCLQSGGQVWIKYN